MLTGTLEDFYQIDNEKSKRWNSLQKKYFIQMHLGNVDYSVKIKEAAKQHRFSLPPDIDELFLKIEEAPVYWLSDTRLTHYLYDFFRIHYSPVNGSDQVKYIKDFYKKWLMIKHQEEKKYFASTAVNFLERTGNKNNFHTIILCGVIFSYDSHLHNYQKAIDLFNRAKEVIYSIKLNEQFRDELEYLIILFSGFASVNSKEYVTAKEYFLKALTIKPNGITAKFYLAFVEIRLSCLQSAEYLIKEILYFDMQRIKYAVETSNLGLFDYFINNSITNHFFYYPEFAELTDSIENLFTSIEESNIACANQLKRKSEIFRKINSESKFQEDLTNQLLFISKLAEDPNRNTNLLFLNSTQKINSQFTVQIELLMNSIKEKYYSTINGQLIYIDSEVSQKSTLIENFKKEFDAGKIEIQSKLEKEVKSFENSINQEIILWEEKIKNLVNESQFNPKIAFNRTMTYNTILSFLSSLMGGCAGYSSSSVSDVLELKNLLSSIVISGLKWGLITFAVGFIISASAAAYALAERSNRKQSLIQRISSLKNEKERKIGLMKKEADRKEKKLTQRYNDEINQCAELIQELLEEKEKRKTFLVAEADKTIAEEIKPLEILQK